MESKRRLGDRKDGRLIHSLAHIHYLCHLSSNNIVNYEIQIIIYRCNSSGFCQPDLMLRLD